MSWGQQMQSHDPPGKDGLEGICAGKEVDNRPQCVSKKSAQVSGIFYSKRTEAQLSKTFDVIAPIQRLYHSTELEFGAVNALPAKVMVEPEICVGPDIGPEPVRREPALPTESQREALRKLAGRLGTGQPLNGTAKKLPTIQ